MRPFELMSGQTVASGKNTSALPVPKEQGIAQFLAVSAQYLGLHAERLTQLKYLKQKSTYRREERSSHD